MTKNAPHKSVNLSWVFRIAATCSLALIYLIQWGSMISVPSRRTGADFIAFYAAGRIAQQSGFSSVYNIAAQHEVEQRVVGFDLAREQVLLYNHIPFLIPILKMLVTADYVGSFARWALLMLGIYAASTIFFLKAVFPNPKDKTRPAAVMGTLTFFPFFISLLLGQDTAILFLGVALWCIGILKKQDWLAAIGLALTTLRPHLCLILAIPLLFRQRSVWWRFFLLAVLLALASIWMLGRQGTPGFLDILRISASGAWHGMNEPAMLNLIGLLLRTLPWLDAGLVRAVGWAGYLAGIGLLNILWLKAPILDERLLSKSLIIALLFAPHLHSHDLTLLIIPLIFAIRLPVPKIPSAWLALLPLAISLLFLLEPLRYILPYVLYAGLFWWFTKKQSNTRTA